MEQKRLFKEDFRLLIKSLFIDDNLEYLYQVRDLKINYFLASWGYNTDEIRKKAKQEGIPVISIEDMPEILGV